MACSATPSSRPLYTSLTADTAPTAPADVVVVVDVLRMTTTAAVLARRGVDALWVVADPEEARGLARRHRALLFGERGMHALPGFDGGNSPVAAARRRDLRGRSAVLCTTNGAIAVEIAGRSPGPDPIPGEAGGGVDRTSSAPIVIALGSPVNASAVAARAAASVRGARLCCAGTGGSISLDDVLGAGTIADALLLRDPGFTPDDTTQLARLAWHAARARAGGLEGALRASQHGRRLVAAGYRGDLRMAADVDAVATAWVREGGPGTPFLVWRPPWTDRTMPG